jgi:hypothetical protein
MRYADELKRSASESAGTWIRTRRWRSYVRDGAKKLSVAACESDPAAAISALGHSYQAQCSTSSKRGKAAEQTEMAKMLMQACRQLALGQNPAPIARPM